MKYVIFKQRFSEKESDFRYVPIIFPNCLVHSSVAEQVLKTEGLEGATVFSAGSFSSLDMSDLCCTSGSESLGVASHEDDARIIRTHDYMHGYL